VKVWLVGTGLAAFAIGYLAPQFGPPSPDLGGYRSISILVALAVWVAGTVLFARIARTRLWIGLVGTAVAVALGLLYGSEYRTYVRTTEHYSHPVIIGTELTPLFKDVQKGYRARHGRELEPSQDLDEALGMGAERLEQIWTRDSIDAVTKKLWALFLGVTGSGLFAVLFGLSYARHAVWMRFRKEIKPSTSKSPEGSWDFFIAYAHEDEDVAEQLYELLAPKARVFLDSRTLKLADEWTGRIKDAHRASRISVILVSVHSGRATFQQDEVLRAIELYEDKSRPHGVTAVYLDTEATKDENVPSGLKPMQSVVLGDDVGLEEVALKLLDALEVR